MFETYCHCATSRLCASSPSARVPA